MYHAIATLALYAVLVNRCINASYGPVQQHQHYSNVVQRVEARAMTWDSVVSSSDLVMLPSMRPEDAIHCRGRPSSQGGNPWWSAESAVGGFLVVIEAG